MGFGQAVRTCLRKYATFSGRAARPEYWYFLLFVFLGGLAASALDAALFGLRPDAGQGPLASLFSLATFLPLLAAAWRRMHDTGRSGLYVLYPLIAMIGIGMFLGFMTGFAPLLAGDLGALFAGLGAVVAWLAMLVLMLSPLLVLWWLSRPGEPGPNAYGRPPAA